MCWLNMELYVSGVLAEYFAISHTVNDKVEPIMIKFPVL